MTKKMDERLHASGAAAALTDTSSRAILKNAAPILFGLLLEQLIGMTDAVFLGRVGEVELGAAALGSVVFFFFIAQALGYAIGAQSLMGRANGSRDYAAFGRVFRQAGLFLFSLGLAVAVLLVLSADAIMSHIADSEAVSKAAADYLFWRGVGMPAAFFCVLLRTFFIAILETRILVWSSLVMVATNCVLNWLLIFGWGPIPPMGTAGAAIASALSEVACAIFLAGKIVRDGEIEKHSLAGSLAFDRDMQLKLFNLGRWLMLQESVSIGAHLFLRRRRTRKRTGARDFKCRTAARISPIPLRSRFRYDVRLNRCQSVRGWALGSHQRGGEKRTLSFLCDDDARRYSLRALPSVGARVVHESS